MKKKILLVEPSFKNKYPPLGLMKLATYHKNKGHEVFFAKGCYSKLKVQEWDRIYVATLFTFYWNITMKTIKYYIKSVKREGGLFIGGVMATLMKKDILADLGNQKITVIQGLLNQKGKLGYVDDNMVDYMTPDYSIIDNESNKYLNYIYPIQDSYIVYATRGCIRKCRFCAVPIIEPTFHNGLSVKKQIKAIKRNFGQKKNLLLLDNNILASTDFNKIIDEIKACGFGKGDKYHYEANGRKAAVKRTVDFNQGLDARLLDENKMKKLSEISIEPLRIAFDDIRYKDIYVDKVRLAAQYGIRVLSNYILFNFKDTPEDFYERLKINIELNEEFQKRGLSSKIWSFPMKYSPIFGNQCKTRKHIGKHWNKKYLRSIQCILIPTHGVVGPNRSYFEKAFGENVKKFKEIMKLPEDYIIHREKMKKETIKLQHKIKSLDINELRVLSSFVKGNEFRISENNNVSRRIEKILSKY